MNSSDEAIEALNNLLADHPMWVGDSGQPLEFHPLREERISQFIKDARPIFGALADRVRAEAVAEERQRIRAAILARRPTDRVSRHDKRWWRAFEHGLDCVLTDLDRPAAGSVPVATPATCGHGCERVHPVHRNGWHMETCPGPVATPTEPAERHVCAARSRAASSTTPGTGNCARCRAAMRTGALALIRSRRLLRYPLKQPPACEHGKAAGHWYRDPECAVNWPEAYSGGYDPRCCRFPKSCSADEWCPGPAEQPEER